MASREVTLTEFVDRYCKTQAQTPEGLITVLHGLSKKHNPDGFFLAEVQQLDSSRLGSVVILPYGPDNTFKGVPHDVYFSPRGLASDMSVAIMHIPVTCAPLEMDGAACPG